jgi:ribonuclease HII
VVFHRRPPPGINDSKQLRPEIREQLFLRIFDAAHVGIGICEVEIIDGINIYHATHAAMCEAVAQLPVKPDAVLVDGNRCPKLDCPAEPLVGGDGLSIAIAAASIIAKVTRDRIMCELSLSFPAYAWHSNKGYGTRQHAAALARFGVTPHHRRSFQPVWERLQLGALATAPASQETSGLSA